MQYTFGEWYTAVAKDSDVEDPGLQQQRSAWVPFESVVDSWTVYTADDVCRLLGEEGAFWVSTLTSGQNSEQQSCSEQETVPSLPWPQSQSDLQHLAGWY